MVTPVPYINLAWLVPALPLLGFLVIGFSNKRLKRNQAGIIASTFVSMSFVASVFLFFILKSSGQMATTITLFDWIAIANLKIPFALLIDHLSLTMMLIVTGVGAMIHIYSIGYMHDDERVNHFFSYMNLFTFSMLLLVMGANYLVLFIGWEGVGLCSYLLIGFWFKNTSYNYAARKAFVMNRIGDLGFILGIVLIFFTFGSVSFNEVFSLVNNSGVDSTTINLITLLLLIGALGKSAQLPLYTWLPDAMAGPTPVSALIHAATMVTAGIYMIARSSVLYNLAPVTQSVIIVIGTATALIGAIIGLRQTDIKKVLAYSTVSQLGYMFIALGLGAYTSALFHVTTHAFFKALLFLGAGSVIHAMSGEQDIRKMGGLRNYMPVTFITFLMATLAISGIPPFSGFFSKDMILTKAFEHHTILYAFTLIGALITCFYMFRLLFLVFFGNLRSTVHPHESPKVMTVPLIILSILAVFGGFMNAPSLFGGNLRFDKYLSSAVVSLHTQAISHTVEIALILSSLSLLAFVIYVTHKIYIVKATVPDSDNRSMTLASKIIANKFYIDEVYHHLFERPYGKLSNILYAKVEVPIIDGAVDGVGNATSWIGSQVRKLQQGIMSFYLFAMVAGILLFIVFILII